MSIRSAQSSSAYVLAIDGLRAVAVLAVIVNHYDHAALPSGYLGVDIFFVISGFVITSALLRQERRDLASYLGHFYASRLKRLVPALVVMVALSWLLIRLFDPDPVASTVAGITSLFGASNLFFYMRAVDYFGQSVRLNVFSHTWSLGVEEQFYLLFPLLLRWTHTSGRPGFEGNLRPISIVAGLSVLSCFAFVTTYASNQPAAYYLTPFRFWELGAGCLVALLHVPERTVQGGGRKSLAALVSFVALLLMLLLPLSLAVPATLATVVLTALLLTQARDRTAITPLLTHPVALYIGRISYSLYLWHWSVICISLWTVGIHAWTVPIQIALTAALAAASYHFIEQPIRYGETFRRNGSAIGTGVGAIALASCLIFLGHRHGLPAFSGSAAAQAAAAAPTPGYVGKHSRRKVDDCFASKVFASGDDASLATRLAACSALKPSATRLAFIGDSHATDMFPLAEAMFERGTVSVINVFQTGCLVPAAPGAPELCRYPSALMQRLDDPHDAGRTVLVIRNNFAPRRVDGSLAQFSTGLVRMLDEAASHHLEVIYVAPAPKYAGVGPNSFCSPQWFRPDWSISDECRKGLRESRQEQLARRSDVMSYLKELERTRAGFYVFDPFDALCGSTGPDCSPMRAGSVLYRDDSHLTEQGAESLAPDFAAFLEARRILEPRSSLP